MHAVFPVETLRANVGAVISHPAGQTNAVSIILATIDMVLATTTLSAARAISVLWTGLIAIGTRPARQTCALTILVVTLSLVLTITLQSAVGTVETRRTGVLTGET